MFTVLRTVLHWSSLILHCHCSSFYPSGAPPWDSRPVNGAGVSHYNLLHRSVPTALDPAPLVTYFINKKLLSFLICRNVTLKMKVYHTKKGKNVQKVSRVCMHKLENNREIFLKSNVCIRSAFIYCCPLNDKQM